MPYPTGGTILRADLRTALEQGLDELKYCIGEKVAPVYPSETKAGQYLFRSLEQRGSKRLDENRRAPGSTYAEVTNSWSSDSFETSDFGYKTTVDDSFEEYADRYLDLETSTARILDAKGMLAYEKRVASTLLGINGYGNTALTIYSGATAYSMANLATVDVVGDIQNAAEILRQFGTMPNTIIMAYPLWNFIRKTSLLQNYVRGNFPTVLPTQVTPEQFANVFNDLGIERLLLAGAYEDLGNEGQVFLGNPIWPNNYFAIAKVAGGDFMGGGVMRTIEWTTDGGFKAVESYRDEDRRSDILRWRQSVIEKVIDARSGVLVGTSASNGTKVT